MKLVPGQGDAGLDPGPLERVDSDGHLAVRWTLRLGVFVAFAVAGACGICALMYGVLAVKLMIVDMPANECSGSQCPRGMTPVFLLAFAFGFVSVWVARLGGKTAGTVSARTLAAVLVFGVLAGVWPAWLGYAWLRGPHMDVAWEVGRDRPSSVDVLGYWASDPSTAIRVRTDGLYAYDTAGGDVRWRAAAPAGTSVCAVSRSTSAGVGIVGFQGGEGSCGASVGAVDLDSGRWLWRKPVPLGEEGGGTSVMTAAGSVAVVQGNGALVGLGLRDGSQLWSAKVSPSCRVQELDAAGDRVLVVEGCTDESGTGVTMRVSAVDASSGERAWQSVLATGGGMRSVGVLSADPIVVHVDEGDQREAGVVVLFDDAGRRKATIPVSGPDGDLVVTAWPVAPGSMPASQVVVSGGLFISVVNESTQGRRQEVSAYSLTDGRRVWHTAFEDAIDRLAPGSDGRINVVTSSSWWHQLWRVDARSGQRRGASVVLRDAPLSYQFDVRPRPEGGYVFVNLQSDSDQPALFAAD
ncbi:PQQ-binding-like beta-propeller repeat protein [Streptomyces sp. NBC_00620]|uniref:outer membrane protein assembly factor BamB family protein n=1 Tax=Streptomyces sp. NBC_00620 TaxID=2903666 RepID=UPI002258AA88|nr:PQQ-binding-like beta-propeller repeat protein [Streptomyces sp. NBC_00620]MCX4972423.1 PQQ-like beta-propeller repeat protein [Streptomyces sp. NBC_00620]